MLFSVVWWRVSLSIRVQTTISTSKKMFSFQSASWKRHCVTHWRDQRCLDSCRQRQISQSDCKINCNCGKSDFKQTLFTPVNSILLDLISATFSEGNLLMTSFSLAGRPRPKTSYSNTGKRWNLITCHHTCTTGLIWYSATNRRDPLQSRHWMCFTTVLMKVWGTCYYMCLKGFQGSGGSRGGPGRSGLGLSRLCS